MSLLCRVLDVSTSGYYAWRKRQPSQRAQANLALVAQIQQVHQASKRRYGSPRVQRALQALGYRCTQKRVARLMQVHGIPREVVENAAADRLKLEGPAIPGVTRNAVADQSDIDDLMAGLGI